MRVGRQLKKEMVYEQRESKFKGMLKEFRRFNRKVRGFVKRQLQYYFDLRTMKSLYTLGEGTQAAKHKIVRRAYLSAAMFCSYRTLRKVGVEIM